MCCCLQASTTGLYTCIRLMDAGTCVMYSLQVADAAAMRCSASLFWLQLAVSLHALGIRHALHVRHAVLLLQIATMPSLDICSSLSALCTHRVEGALALLLSLLPANSSSAGFMCVSRLRLCSGHWEVLFVQSGASVGVCSYGVGSTQRSALGCSSSLQQSPFWVHLSSVLFRWDV